MIILLMSILFSNNINAKTSEEIWKKFTGTNFCEKNFCAEKISPIPLDLALNYYNRHIDRFNNFEFIGIIDFDLKSSEKRFFILNMKTGAVDSMLVTHGKNSETKNATAESFSNEIGSEKSSLGFYSTGNLPYEGKHGKSLKLNGLSATNSNAFERGIVIHSADYATQSFVDERGRLGLSQGCPAVSPNKIENVINKLKGRALLIIYSSQLGPDFVD